LLVGAGVSECQETLEDRHPPTQLLAFGGGEAVQRRRQDCRAGLPCASEDDPSRLSEPYGDRATVRRVGQSLRQPGLYEPVDLRGRTRLAAVIGRGQRRDPRGFVLLDQGKQPQLC
jgi:hypothetical protein